MNDENNETLKNILDKVAKEQKYDDCEISIKSTSSGGANYTSYLHLATISAPAKDDLKLFIKLAAMGEKMRSISPLRIFETESFFYNTILKVYHELEERNMVPVEHRLVTPKFYASNDECFKEVLVLEDMTATGYQAFDRFTSIDWNYAAKSVQNLAKLHALSIAWSIDDPEGFSKTSALKSEANLAAILKFIRTVMDKAIDVTRPENKERMAKFLADKTKENVFADFCKPMRCTVIGHGDYRPSNLLHRLHDDGQIDIVSVDYQTLQMSNPIVDLVYFIFVGSDKKFRRDHLKQTIDHYYAELSAALKRLGLSIAEIYPRDDYDSEFKKVLPFGLLICILCLLIVTVQEEDAPKVNKDIEINDFAVAPSDLYKERLNDIIDDYIDMGVI